MECVDKKRKKKSFIQKSAKYGKKGIYGRGFHINEETYQYFIHILKISDQEFDTTEEKQMFVDNVFEQLNGNEKDYCQNQIVSRVVDNLLPSASEKYFFHLMQIFSGDLDEICCDQFASYVMQKLLVTATQRCIDISKSANEEQESASYVAYKSWIIRVSSHLGSDLEKYIYDPFANHILRTVLACLTCVPDLDYLAWDELISGLLQIVAITAGLINKKKLKSFGVKLLTECFTIKYDIDTNCEEEVPVLFQKSNPCLRLLEVILSVAGKKLYTKIYTTIFKNRLLKLATRRASNYSVQKLLMNSKKKEEFEAICDELFNHFEDIMRAENSGVILQISAGCVRFKTKQSVFMQMWLKYLNCFDTPVFIIPLTLCLLKKEEYSTKFDDNDAADAVSAENELQKKFRITFQGSSILQNMLRFNKPIKVIKSLLEMNSANFVSVLCDPKGSFIANAFFDSEYVGEKSKQKFIDVLQGQYTKLCSSKHGSRVFDIIWKNCSVKNKIFIISELSENESKLNSTQFGHCIGRNISLGSFRNRRDEWIKSQNKGNKVEKLFSGRNLSEK